MLRKNAKRAVFRRNAFEINFFTKGTHIQLDFVYFFAKTPFGYGEFKGASARKCHSLILPKKFYAFYAFYAPRVQRQTHVRVHTSRVTNFAFDTYPRKMHFERRTAQKLARTIFRVVPNCARGGGGWIKSSSSLASEASALAFGQPARFARGLDKMFAQ